MYKHIIKEANTESMSKRGHGLGSVNGAQPLRDSIAALLVAVRNLSLLEDHVHGAIQVTSGLRACGCALNSHVRSITSNMGNRVFESH